MKIPDIAPGVLPPCPVAPDALVDIKRQQTNPARWAGEGWEPFVAALAAAGIELLQDRPTRGTFATDAGGTAYGMPHGVVIARSARQVAGLLKAAQAHRVPVTVRGGGLTTEGESVAFGGVLLDMTGMSRVLSVDKANLTVRTEAGIFWASLAESLRRHGMDYLSAPLNMTSSVGGSIGVGGIDVNSPRLGCSADQAIALQVVTPTGEIVECSDTENAALFQRVVLGYGQFGVITEATMKIRPYTPLKMRYYYYASLRTAIEDLQRLDREDAADYSGILTMMDRAINLLVAFDSDEREAAFDAEHASKVRGMGEAGFTVYCGLYYLTHPWRWREALFLKKRKDDVFPEFRRPEHLRDGRMHDRTVVFSRAVWRHWGNRQMVIPDLATSAEKFIEAVERGNQVCRKYFPHYTLYCVGIRLREDHRPHYEMSCIPPDAAGIAYGCEFEPIIGDAVYSRDTLQSFKNAIYDIGVDMGASYYRFGGMMKGYIRRVFGDALVDRHLAMKREADPAMVLNRDVIFLRRVRNFIRDRIPRGSVRDARSTYSAEAPSSQTLADIFKGSWLSRFPAACKVEAGDRPHFDEGFVQWADGVLPGGVRGRRVLELGPFEAYHTWILEQLGAASVTSIEASDINTLKCLLVKEITGMKARFHHGDFIKYLEGSAETFDLAWASGVLYHQSDPVRLLELLAGAADTVFLHSHYYEADVVQREKSVSRFFDPSRDVERTVRGRRVRLRYRSYREPKRTLFAGGPEAFSYWMEKDDILGCLRDLGLVHVSFGLDHPDSLHGPAFILLASRSPL